MMSCVSDPKWDNQDGGGWLCVVPRDQDLAEALDSGSDLETEKALIQEEVIPPQQRAKMWKVRGRSTAPWRSKASTGCL